MKKILSAIVVVLLFSFPAKAFSEPDGVLFGDKIRLGEYAPIFRSSVTIEPALVDELLESESLNGYLIPILFRALINENYSLYHEAKPDIVFKGQDMILGSKTIAMSVSDGEDASKGFPQESLNRIIGIKLTNEQYLGIIFPYNEDHFYTITITMFGIDLTKYAPIDSFDYYYEKEQEKAELNLENALDALENAYEKKPSPPSFDSNNN